MWWFKGGVATQAESDESVIVDMSAAGGDISVRRSARPLLAAPMRQSGTRRL